MTAVLQMVGIKVPMKNFLNTIPKWFPQFSKHHVFTKEDIDKHIKNIFWVELNNILYDASDTKCNIKWDKLIPGRITHDISLSGNEDEILIGYPLWLIQDPNGRYPELADLQNQQIINQQWDVAYSTLLDLLPSLGNLFGTYFEKDDIIVLDTQDSCHCHE